MAFLIIAGAGFIGAMAHLFIEAGKADRVARQIQEETNRWGE